MTVLERIGQSLLRAALVPLPRVLRDPNLAQFLSSNGTSSSSESVTVTEGTALRIPSVWAAVQCIAGDVASLPFFHYKETATDFREKFRTSKLYRVLHSEFNSEMSAFIGRETMTAHLLLWGNAYAEIVRNDLGQVVALYPIEPNRVMPEREGAGPLVYRVATGDGTQVRVPAERILHIPGLGFNGLMGYPVITMHRQSLGVGAAAEKLGGDVMSRGAKYSGFFEHPRTLGATAHAHLKESLATDLPGTYRILEEGMTYKPGSMPLRDAQFMEIRKFSVTEVARIFGIPPHKLGDLERATFSNIEEQNIDYVIGTLRRWLVRWEQECNRKLIAPLEKGLQFCEHVVDGLMRGKTLDRIDGHVRGVNGGIFRINDVRRLENMEPVPGGDDLLIQGAMIPLKRLHDLVDAQVRPPPAPAGPDPDGAAEADDEAEDARTARLAAVLVAELRAAIGPPTAMLAHIASKLVRRELAQLKKRAADPTAAALRLEKFYGRFVLEGARELTPWLTEPVATRVLTAWAEGAVAEWAPALARGELAAVVRRWEAEREAALTQTLVEASHG